MMLYDEGAGVLKHSKVLVNLKLRIAVIVMKAFIFYHKEVK